MSKILYLNGPSSCGKTTLAKALQESLEEPYLHIGIDKIIGFMPDKLNNWTGERVPDGFSWEKTIDSTGQPVYQIHSGPFAKRIVATLKDIAHLLASQGYNLIIDDVAFGAIEVEQWKQVLNGFSTFYIGVTTPFEILEGRERSRGDLFLGSARHQYFKVHENADYDLEIDTHTHSLQENIEKILNLLCK